MNHNNIILVFFREPQPRIFGTHRRATEEFGSASVRVREPEFGIAPRCPRLAGADPAEPLQAARKAARSPGAAARLPAPDGRPPGARAGRVLG